jgi:hypothetical protein
LNPGQFDGAEIVATTDATGDMGPVPEPSRLPLGDLLVAQAEPAVDRRRLQFFRRGAASRDLATAAA